MKQVYALVVVLLAVMGSCGGKKERTSIKKEQLMYQIDSVDHRTGVQRMQVSRTEMPIEAGGRKYSLFVERAPSDSLPRVHTDMGVFADNRIVVRITREGKRIYNKVFTKSAFAGYVSEKSLRSFVLEGVVFDEEKTKAAKGNIILASSIGYPQTDLYIPFTITVTPDGRMSITKNEDLDELTPIDSI